MSSRIGALPCGSEAKMATYLCMYKWTEKGIGHIKESPARLEAARRTAKAMGGDLKQFFMLLGERDTAAIFVAPDDETMARINLAMCSQGNVVSETMRAFTEEEYRKILGSLP
jgi:uncharacterized protein with GYD domain